VPDDKAEESEKSVIGWKYSESILNDVSCGVYQKVIIIELTKMIHRRMNYSAGNSLTNISCFI